MNNEDKIKDSMSQHEPATVVTPITTVQLPDATWQPIIGQEAHDLVNRKQLLEEEGRAVIESAASILACGIAPTEQQSHKTGLVVGYVQSGKTLSFTTVIALARDNGYRLIIAVAGTSKPLLEQSTRRLRNDLAVDDIDGNLRWSMITNPTDTENYRRSIDLTLDEWRDSLVPDSERPTVLITVMKNHNHLNNLVALLRRLNLQDVPTLVVDDEADQASLNTLVRRGRESTTYRRLLELRETLPSHTFLQYTATPQAPLLINIIDSLSPDFVTVLTPGTNYVGGLVFFEETHELTRVIPYEDVPTAENQVLEPPHSLLNALRVFLVGVASGLCQGRSRNNLNRSMLVHPSRKTVQHQEYSRWIGHVFEQWRKMLELPEDDSDRVDLIEDFRDAYADLFKTVGDLPDFDKIAQMLPRAFRRTSIEEVNARVGGKTPTIEWTRSYGWILVGGQAMDRGFTVEGLTVTYMPRDPGMGNADTIQQRGRFFGYKRPYLGYCRIYLEQEVLSAFKRYVEHEEEMRRQLQSIHDDRKPLKDWKRAFVLSPELKPCRNSVIQHGYARGSYADSWFTPSVVLNAESVVAENRGIARNFLNSLTFTPNVGSQNREPAQIHHVSYDASLMDVVGQLLSSYRFTAAKDTQDVTGLLLQLAHALEQNPNERCVVYRISPNFIRQRSVNKEGKIRNLFQGAAPVNPPRLRGTIYPGDREIHDKENVTIQVHLINLIRDNEIVAEDVPVTAVWVPKRMALDWITQGQP